MHKNKSFVFLLVLSLYAQNTFNMKKRKRNDKIPVQAKRIKQNPDKKNIILIHKNSTTHPAHAWFNQQSFKIATYTQENNKPLVYLNRFEIKNENHILLQTERFDRPIMTYFLDEPISLFWLGKKFYYKIQSFLKCSHISINNLGHSPLIYHKDFSYYDKDKKDLIKSCIFVDANGFIYLAYEHNTTPLGKRKRFQIPLIDTCIAFIDKKTTYIVHTHKKALSVTSLILKDSEANSSSSYNRTALLHTSKSKIHTITQTSKRSYIGKYIATVSDNGINIWDPLRRALIWSIPVSNAQTARFTRDGKCIVSYHEPKKTANDEIFSRLCIWSILRKKLIHTVDFKKCTTSHPKLDISYDNKHALLFDDKKIFLMALPLFKENIHKALRIREITGTFDQNHKKIFK